MPVSLYGGSKMKEACERENQLCKGEVEEEEEEGEEEHEE